MKDIEIAKVVKRVAEMLVYHGASSANADDTDSIICAYEKYVDCLGLTESELIYANEIVLCKCDTLHKAIREIIETRDSLEVRMAKLLIKHGVTHIDDENYNEVFENVWIPFRSELNLTGYNEFDSQDESSFADEMLGDLDETIKKLLVEMPVGTKILTARTVKVEFPNGIHKMYFKSFNKKKSHWQWDLVTVTLDDDFIVTNCAFKSTTDFAKYLESKASFCKITCCG